MTVSTRTSAPSYKIFEPDALDQIYAKGVISDPIMGGIAGAMGLAHDMSKSRNQNNYIASQSDFNKMAGNLDAMEIQQKQKAEILKAATALLGHGAATTDLEPGALSGLFNQQGYQNDTLGRAMRDKMEADAQNARSGGSGGGNKEFSTETSVDAATGQSISHKYPGPPRAKAAPDVSGSTPTPARGALSLQELGRRAAIATGDPDGAQVGTAANGNVRAASPKTGKMIELDRSGNQVNR